MARPTSPDQKKAHQLALQKFKASASFFNDQRLREVADLKFIDFDEQWEPQVKTQRSGGQSVDGLPQTPPRPTITINQLLAPISQVASQRRAARLALQFSAKGGNANDDVAQAYEDIARDIQASSGAMIARNWAADRSEKAGMGWYRIDSEYALENPEPDDPGRNDQNIVYRRILNQASVYPDQNAQEADFSDGKCLFVTQDMPLSDYRDQYGDSDLAQADESELTAVGDERPDWVFTADVPVGDVGKTIRVAEYWEVVETRRKRVELDTGESAYDDEIPEGATVNPKGATRYLTSRKVMWSKINAIEYLEGPQEWNGAYIPIIPTVWKESNVNGERRWTGIVRPGKEAAVSYNVLRSAVHEAVALATKAPYIGYWKVIEKFQQWWKQSNTRNLFMLPIDIVYDSKGNLLPAPESNVKEPAIQALMAAAAAAKDDIHSTTGVPPVSLGEIDPTNRSGAAIRALQGQAETGASTGVDHIVSISLPYEGKVLRDMIPRIYDRPGRLVPALADDDTRRMVLINMPYIEGPDGTPQPVPGWHEGMPIPPGAKYLDLRKGEYAVQASAGKDYPTRKKQASEATAELMKTLPPEMAAALAPAMIEELDTPGARKLASIAKQALPPQLQQAYDDGAQQIPPEAQAKIQQQGQMVEELTAHVNALTQQIQAKQVEGQIDLQKAEMDNATKIKIAEIQATASMSNAQAKVDAENFRSYADALDKDVARKLSLHLEAVKHIVSSAARGQEHAHEIDMAALEHQHALEQASQAAALAPDPTDRGQSVDTSGN